MQEQSRVCISVRMASAHTVSRLCSFYTCAHDVRVIRLPAAKKHVSEMESDTDSMTVCAVGALLHVGLWYAGAHSMAL